MKIFWQSLLILLSIYESQNQLIRQQTFSKTGNVLPHVLYFDVYKVQSVTVSFSTRCPNLRINFMNQNGVILYSYSPSANWQNNGYTYSYQINIGTGLRQSIGLIDWWGYTSCSWSYSFKLDFNCSFVTDKCHDCTSYTTCTSCVSGNFLYQNKCYLNIPNCLARSGLNCLQCTSEYILISNACRLCSSFMPYCSTCPDQNSCSTCKVGYALTAGNAGCDFCSNFITDCLECSSSSVCTKCPKGLTVANPTTCQLCSVTLSNCLQCSSTSQCTKCDIGYALDSSFQCQTCSFFISDCTLCSSSSYCTRCPFGFSLSPTACTVCSTTVVGCRQCSSTGCIGCYEGYWFDNGNCHPCTNTLSNCVNCRNSTFCDSCDVGYGLKSSYVTWFDDTVGTVITRYYTGHRQCQLCSSVLNQCADCNSLQYCDLCNPAYFLNSYRCYSCAQLMSNCLTCTSSSYCTSCVNNQFALTNNNQYCSSCLDLMTNCLTCSDRTTCTSCKNVAVLKDARCRPCHIVLPFCKTCTSETVCTSCQVSFQIDPATSTCKPCDFFIANYSICSSTTVCTQCFPGTILKMGSCKTCGQVFPNCLSCISNTSCALCNTGSVVFQGQCEPCKTFINHCSNCLETSLCQQCEDPYQTNYVKKCKCKSPLYNVSDYCVADANCVSAYKKNNIIYCSFCNIAKLFYLDDFSKCVCKQGYRQINDQCVEYCGDGIKAKHECDDNNTIDGDGCSSQCKVQANFQCKQLLSGVSQCRFVKNIQLRYEYTFKQLYENKGQITITLKSQNPNIIKFYNSMTFKFQVFHNRSDSLNITNFIRNDQGQILIDIDYNKTIENTSIELRFKFDTTKVLSEDNFIAFQFKGSNYPLVISEMTEDFKFISKVLKVLSISAYVVALLLLVSDKFIAVEGINTLQLIFFSLLLIYQNTDWSQAMVALMPMKYSTGFNPFIFQPNPFDNIKSTAYRKFQYIGICSSFLKNNLTNCIILFIGFSVFLVAFNFKIKPQNALLELKEGPQKKKISKQLSKIRKIFKKVYNVIFHFSYTMVLQLIISIYVELSFIKNMPKEMIPVNSMTMVISSMIVITTILQNYKHLFLSKNDTQINNFRIGSWESSYRKVYFLYVLVNAACLFILNDKKLFGFTTSLYLLVLNVFYLLYLAIYRPYRFSFAIHGFTVIFNQVAYVLTLLLISAINLQVKLSQVYFLVFSYLIIGFVLVIIIFMLIRVFYDFKYGDEHVKQHIQIELKGRKQRQDQRLLNKAVNMENKVTKEDKNAQNPFLYENQKLKAQQIQFLDDLKNKGLMNEWERDLVYFELYKRKPIEWVKKNQTKQKYQFLLQKEKQRFQRNAQKQKMIQKSNQKSQNKNYCEEMQKVKQRLKKQHGIKELKRAKKKEDKKATLLAEKQTIQTILKNQTQK